MIIAGCLAISLLFWFFVKLSQDYPVLRPVQIDYVLPEGHSFLSQPPDLVDASIRGKGWDLIPFYINKSVSIQMDADQEFGRTISEQALFRRVEAAFRSHDLTLEAISYEPVNLQYEATLEKKVPIRFRGDLQFAVEHHLREAPVLKPDSVIVSGPKSLISTIDSWPTDSIVLSDLRADQALEVQLTIPENGSIRLFPDKTQANLSVELFVEKDFFVPVEVNWQSDSTAVVPYPRFVKVTAVVGMSRFNDLTAEDFTLVANLEGIEIRSENDLAPLQITRAPDYVRNIRLGQQSARFTFAIQDTTVIE